MQSKLDIFTAKTIVLTKNKIRIKKIAHEYLIANEFLWNISYVH